MILSILSGESLTYKRIIIPNFSNYYIDTNGMVYFKTGRKLKALKYGSNGYNYVFLYLNKKRHRKYIHRLVAEAFILNPENKYSVNHKDTNKNNNNVLNLEWATQQEQIEHVMSLDLMPKGEDCGAAKLTEQQAKEIKYSKENSKFLAKKYNITCKIECFMLDSKSSRRS